MKVIASVLPGKDSSNVDMTLSVSKYKTFEDCKAKYKFCYIEKLPKIDRDFHIFGKYLHQILENFHESLINDSSKKENWPQVLADAKSLAYDEYADKLTGDQIKEASSIISKYEKIIDEDGLPNIIANEKPFYINLNDKVLLNGFIDRIQIDDDGILHVADYKTTKDPKYLKDFFQLITYCYALMLEDESIERIRASFILLRHSFNYLTEEYTRDEVIHVAEKFLKRAYDIEEEKLFRPNPQFLCKYCDYIDHCSDGQNFLIKKGMMQNKNNKKDIKPFVGVRKW